MEVEATFSLTVTCECGEKLHIEGAPFSGELACASCQHRFQLDTQVSVQHTVSRSDGFSIKWADHMMPAMDFT